MVGDCRGIAGAEEFQNLAQRDADLNDMRGQPENLAELMVGADQLQVRIEYGNALAHVVERGLQDLAVEMQCGVGIIE